MDKLLGTIKAISVKNKDEGEIGFLTLENPDKWYNVKAPEDAIEVLLKDIIQKGNFIEFEYDGFLCKSFVLKTQGTQTSKPGEKKKEGNWADEMTNFEDLLTDAHKKGLISINTEMISVDFITQKAVFKAVVTGYLGEDKAKYVGTFTGYGDAEAITNASIKPHFMRMAETRSIVRALRWYTNNAAVAEEETEKK